MHGREGRGETAKGGWEKVKKLIRVGDISTRYFNHQITPIPHD